ncbi:MAG: TolC family protein [Chitinophagaceae bacterium]|nr:TolC family protein [Chitinophagaceae bacterium]
MERALHWFILVLLFIINFSDSYAQKSLSLTEAVETGVKNYLSISAKNNYAEASRSSVEQARRDYWPNANIAAQQDYGTINGQNGPLYGFGGLNVASSGLPLDHQNWNAAFGALYLANVNWDFFAFGRARYKVKTAEAIATRDRSDYEQEIFQHKIKVASAYLNLLAAHHLTTSWRKNLERTDTLKKIIVAKALNGLVPGVDSSQANAEVSNAIIELTRAIDFEQEQANRLSVLMGVPSQRFILDSLFLLKIPAALTDTITQAPVEHPVLAWYKNRKLVSDEQSHYFNTFKYPVFSLVGVYQFRGSGFSSNYAQNQDLFTKDYWEGIKPVRTNYLIGVGLTWNITQPFRISQQVKAQNFISAGLNDEYNLANQQIQAQLDLSATKIKNALSNYEQAPVQVKAAQDAYLQRATLYRNGLSDLVSVTQAAYVLIRAETDRDIAYNNVWQALLLRAAAAGSFELFAKEIQ